ncbi:MAG: hypothetical protein JST68_05615 [Bacteroidetes bacterium]|nr:hypothetical protein [Bacteroidota bacterium]
MRRFFRFPEVLLLVFVVCFGLAKIEGDRLLALLLLISWVLHLVLRLKHPANYPSLISRLHVWLSVILSIPLLIYAVSVSLWDEMAASEILGGFLLASVLAGSFLLLVVQGVFWLAAGYSLWQRGRDLRPR